MNLIKSLLNVIEIVCSLKLIFPVVKRNWMNKKISFTNS